MKTHLSVEGLLADSRDFFEWAVNWNNGLEAANLDDIAAEPARVAILSVDVIKGFCSVGPLASERVAGIVAPIADLLRAAHTRGVRHFVLTQDAHEEDAPEFASYRPHCIRGTEQAETVDELRALPFFDEIVVLEKNSISSSHNTGLDGWLDAHPEVTTFVVVGDCTDLCTYQLAMHLRLRANAHQRAEDRVIVPANTVDTYDLPVAEAEKLGATPHPAELLHLIFLYSMLLNGVEVVAEFVAERRAESSGEAVAP